VGSLDRLRDLAEILGKQHRPIEFRVFVPQTDAGVADEEFVSSADRHDHGSVKIVLE
jgi:hypothetical protein